MQRYRNCSVKVNKNKVCKLVIDKYVTVSNYCRKFNISRVRFYTIINNPHLSEESICLKELSKNLEVSVNEILM